jgi:hypothetical protein
VKSGIQNIPHNSINVSTDLQHLSLIKGPLKNSKTIPKNLTSWKIFRLQILYSIKCLKEGEDKVKYKKYLSKSLEIQKIFDIEFILKKLNQVEKLKQLVFTDESNKAIFNILFDKAFEEKDNLILEKLFQEGPKDSQFKKLEKMAIEKFEEI